MRIPESQSDREQFYADLVQRCFASRQERKARYDILNNWFLFGNGLAQELVEYNKLYPHIDLLASFLFSGETTSFVIEVPKTAEIEYEFEIEKAKLLIPKVNETWHDSNVDITFNDALILALVKDTSFIKIVPRGKREFMSYVVGPESIGVLREDVTTLDQQECVAHEYFIPLSELTRMIEGYGPAEQERILSYVKKQEDTKDQNAVPAGVQTIIINATKPETGEVSGSLNKMFAINNNFQPTVSEEGVLCYELQVYDDNLKDYRTVQMLNGECILFDAQKNSFFPGEIGLVKITPNSVDGYFWGRSELMYLIPLQEWINTRIPEIKMILAKLAKPPISAFGMQEAKLTALFMAGGIAASDNPASMGAIKEHFPQSAQELFKELQMIEAMFNEVSGIREIMKGGGESGVRAMGHADMLAKLGSTRAKKKAAILEDAVEKCATLLLKAIRKYDDTYFRTENGTKFIAQFLTDAAQVKVDSHSSSPIFVQELMDKASMLFQAGAIDKEDLIDAARYQNAEYLKGKLKKREAENAPIAHVESLVAGAKEADATSILNKLKQMFKKGTTRG